VAAVTISPALGLAIMMNNYFHDVATALLLGSAVALWAMVKRFDPAGGPAVTRYLLRIHGAMTGLARIALAWIVLGGVPRVIFFMDFEWANAVGRLQVPALVLKHVLIFAAVGAGAALWLRLRRRMRELERSLA
jgi:hypothetical protein